jgi:type VI secretion system protein ImpL
MFFQALKSRQVFRMMILLSLFIWNLSAYGTVVWGNDSENVAHKTVKQNYQVKVGLFPMATNPGAQLQPHTLILELQCGQDLQRLQSMGFPTSKTFAWSPGQCGDVHLFVHIGDLILKKTFTGASGFPDFLREFSDGPQLYHPGDFDPDESEQLNMLGVEFLNIRFRLAGDVEDVLRFASK